MIKNISFSNFIPVTYDCNEFCLNCPVQRKQNKVNPSLSTLKAHVDKIAKHSRRIDINGGEPLLRSDLLLLLKYIESKNLEISLLTNAQLFSYKKNAFLFSKIKKLKVITTIYGLDNMHDSISRTPNSFHKKIQGVKNLIYYKVAIEFRVLLLKQNYKEIDSITDFIIENFKPSDFVQLVFMNPKLTQSANQNKKIIAEKISVIAEKISNSLHKLSQLGYNVELYHFPHCILPSTIQHLSKGLTASSPIVEYGDYCRECIKKEFCSRIWKSYLDEFGSEEFKPIK
ncbi:MAG: radical SAM protein [Candidatus Woesearchaeota archaeon]